MESKTQRRGGEDFGEKSAQRTKRSPTEQTKKKRRKKKKKKRKRKE